MKTLDEVIKANECCDHGEPDSRCEDCPYNGIGACCAERETDALHYLKEYRSDKAMWEADRKSYQGFVDSYIKSRDKHQAAVIELKHKEREVNDILTDYVALKQWWAEQQENPAMTWDELRTMEGKPVWFEGYAGNFWCIVREMQKNSDGTEDVILDGPHGMTGVGHDDQYGDKWQAYRKER